MTDMEYVSIIVPVYNVEDYLDRCVGSIVRQTHRQLEIILVDDGSTDASPEICQRWAEQDDRIRVVRQTNCGVSGARNAGLRTASHDWIMQIDSDDYIAQHTVENMLRAACNGDADMVICDFEKGKEDAFAFEPDAAAAAAYVDGVTALSRIYEGEHNALRYAVPWCKLCRRRLFEGIAYPDGKIFEDIYTTHKLLLRCDRIAVLDECLFYYFQRPGSIMNMSFNMKKLDYLQALVERVEYFSQRGLTELARTAYDELLHSLIWEYSRTRDLLNNQAGMDYVTGLFRSVYKKGYASRRYPGETARFLGVFYRNPEWIILYWRISAKLKQMTGRNG